MDIYSIISKSLSGQSTVEEEYQLDNWRSQSSENEREYQELVESWNLSVCDRHIPVASKERVWGNIMSRINGREIDNVHKYSIKTLYRVALLAAMVALLIGFSISFVVGRQDNRMIYSKTQVGQKAEVLLPDGTKVLLNSNSELAYPLNYGKTNRVVKLKGEAFFDVAKDKSNPFAVITGEIKVKVHGTTFDVNAYQSDAKVIVTLLTGKVSMEEISSRKILAVMEPGQVAVVNTAANNKLQLSKCDVSEAALWRIGKLKINGERIEHVIQKMESWYGVNINLTGVSSPDKLYWMTIKTESLKEMLEIINIITPIEYSINGEEVTVSYK